MPTHPSSDREPTTTADRRRTAAARRAQRGMTRRSAPSFRLVEDVDDAGGATDPTGDTPTAADDGGAAPGRQADD